MWNGLLRSSIDLYNIIILLVSFPFSIFHFPFFSSALDNWPAMDLRRTIFHRLYYFLLQIYILNFLFAPIILVFNKKKKNPSYPSTIVVNHPFPQPLFSGCSILFIIAMFIFKKFFPPYFFSCFIILSYHLWLCSLNWTDKQKL